MALGAGMISTERVEAEIRSQRPELLEAQSGPGEFVLPHYERYSLANLASTVLSHFGAETVHPPLPQVFLPPEKREAHRVVLFLIDALGYRQLTRFLERDPQTRLGELVARGRCAPLTSVFPSTTTAALATLSTGLTPQEHGILGYRLFLKRWGVIANMVRLSPAGDPTPDRLFQMGLKPRSFLGRPTLYDRLARRGVRSYVLIKEVYARSGLSQMLNPKVATVVPFASSSDMSVVLKKLLQATAERAFVFAYWDALDALAHRYGPESEEWDAELRGLAYALTQGVLSALDAPFLKDTLLLIGADHGQLEALPKDEIVQLKRYPALKRCLALTPTGEYRASYLHAKPGRLGELEDGLLERFADRLVVLRSPLALEAGLFGRGATHPETEDRIGDLVVVPKGRQVLYWPYDRFNPGGRHGGLTDEEMLVPLIAL